MWKKNQFWLQQKCDKLRSLLQQEKLPWLCPYFENGPWNPLGFLKMLTNCWQLLVDSPKLWLVPNKQEHNLTQITKFAKINFDWLTGVYMNSGTEFCRGSSKDVCYRSIKLKHLNPNLTRVVVGKVWKEEGRWWRKKCTCVGAGARTRDLLRAGGESVAPRHSVCFASTLFRGYSLTECMLDYHRCQVNWFTLSLLFTNHWTNWTQYKAYGISYFGIGVCAKAWTSI